MKFLLKPLLHLIFPEICLGCGNSLYQGEKVICTKCEVALPRTRFHDNKNNKVARIFWGRIPIYHATSFLFYRKKSIVQRLIHQLKYKQEKEIGIYLGELFAEELSSVNLFQDIEVIVPVPLHYKKQQRRGYNQSVLISQGLSNILKKPVDKTSLIRELHNPTQTNKSRFQRWENVSSIFSLTKSHQLTKKKILLVDDVITTGATIEACARTLIHQAKARVSVVSLAVAY